MMTADHRAAVAPEVGGPEFWDGPGAAQVVEYFELARIAREEEGVFVPWWIYLEERMWLALGESGLANRDDGGGGL